MLDIYKTLITQQYAASLATLNSCVERCPDDVWDGPVAKYAFCQVALHALFFADLYLGPNPEAFKEQPFHREHAEFFGDYEELEREPVRRYQKPEILTYVEFVRNKANEVLAAETEDILGGPSGFDWYKVTRAEMHVCNIRHIQHHAAQLILRLRLDSDTDIGWFRSGWPSDAR